MRTCMEAREARHTTHPQRGHNWVSAAAARHSEQPAYGMVICPSTELCWTLGDLGRGPGLQDRHIHAGMSGHLACEW